MIMSKAARDFARECAREWLDSSDGPVKRGSETDMAREVIAALDTADALAEDVKALAAIDAEGGSQ